MRKIAFLMLLALSATLALGACDKKDTSEQPAEQQAQTVTKPASPTDKAAWGKYLAQTLAQHMQGMTADRPYAYLVPGGDDAAAVAERGRQMDNVSGIVMRGILPGNLMALGGPDSAKTADFMVTAFAKAQPGSLKGVIVLFIGDKADEQRVADAVKPSGAKFRFVEM